MTQTTITVDFRPLRSSLRRFLRSREGEVAFKQMSVIYRSFAQRRFSKYSRGGGNWKPLKASTIRRRRKGSSVILRDTGRLFSALSPTVKSAGWFEERRRNTLTVGYGGGAPHSGKTTISEIASYHQTGAGHLPKRELIVEPDAPTLNRMTKAVTDALQRRLN